MKYHERHNMFDFVIRKWDPQVKNANQTTAQFKLLRNAESVYIFFLLESGNPNLTMKYQ